MSSSKPTIGVPKETLLGERRVGLTPDVVAQLLKRGFKEILVEANAGHDAGYTNDAFIARGATVTEDRKKIFERADIIVQVNTPGANPEQGEADLELLRPGQILVGQADPLGNPEMAERLAEKKITAFGLELVPRITRAQSMDILSSGATIAGYKAVLTAANELPKMFPMFMTAAGTVKPAKVFVIGAGVAGLQAIATAKRLGAIVSAYDIRPAVKEQVESVGGRFVELKIEAAKSEDKGGYAKAMDEEFYRRQRELMLEVVKDSDVVITTAAIPGRKAPILVTEEMVVAMPTGAVIVDLAAERGGNCELTVPGETVTRHDVRIIGPRNVPASIPFHASQMYARNVTTFLINMVKDDQFTIDTDDQIVRDTLLTTDGVIVNARLRKMLGKDALKEPKAKEEPKAEDSESKPETAGAA